ncbi:nicotinamide riboside transporter PnuC [Dysgonomonas sp. 511]|uniref:nicotinamide riboside transporter PnuC n=1 Tax=Dysgonomonas sp. 511 TaxID=2302930 RepID=UPI0013D41EC5|nr:nicotinamide riboside transporter PnuC [Dysgonomonas sp. 511]NDV79325.1 hypothetical protein [Dysgonomonas sp. 511]
MDDIFLFLQANWVSLAGAAIGILFLYLEYKANVWMWAASILMAAFYIYIFYRSSLFASMGIYIYFFLASVYGWVMWVTRNRNRDTGNEIISRTPSRYSSPIFAATIIIAIAIYFILVASGHNLQLITIGDALTTSLNIVALWMISRKWAEQWLLVIPANLLSAILLFAQNDALSGVLFAIYFVVSIFGYRKWVKMAA